MERVNIASYIEVPHELMSKVSSMRESNHKVRFGEQAHVFEQRAGLPDEVASQIADAIRTYACLPDQGVVVDIGAGTGEIGQWLARGSHSYVAIDSSDEMLAEFKAKLSAGSEVNLVLADADKTWPVATGSAHVVFGSRVFHLLDIHHLLAEARRVAAPEGAYLISGRVMRTRDSIKNILRKKMRDLLVEKGFEPRTDQQRKQVFLEAQKHGARILEPMVSAEWEVLTRPSDSIEAWRQKESMGGINPPDELRLQVLDLLTTWATEKWGDPHTQFSSSEHYLLEGARLN